MKSGKDDAIMSYNSLIMSILYIGVLWLYSFFIYGNTRTDGGISNNDFVLQLIADITNKSIIRFPSPDMSAIGAALMAGVEKGNLL